MSVVTIVALGDSTTAGTPGFKSPIERRRTAPETSRASTAYWLMQIAPRLAVLNRGVNGERSDQIRARFTRDVLDAKPSVVRDHRRRQRHLPGTRGGGRGARAGGDVRRGARRAHPGGRRNDPPLQSGGRRRERSDARRERLDPRLCGAARGDRLLRHPRGGQRSGAARPPGVLSRWPPPVS